MNDLLTKEEIKELIEEYGEKVSLGRDISELIKDGEILRLKDCKVQKGKVSDSVFGKNLKAKDGKPIRLMFRTSRISTHDVNRGEIPFKDQVLAINHDFMLNKIRHLLGSAQFQILGIKPTSTVIASENTDVIMFENVIRAYMAKSSTSTSLYQHYMKGEREFCGHKLPENLEPNSKLPYIMDTPSTKEKNDKSVSSKHLIENKICSKEEYNEIKAKSIEAFKIVSDYMKDRKLILVDTKTEHGRNSRGEIVVIDEVYTLDSSRFWRINEIGEIEKDSNGEPKSFSKEFARGMVVDEKNQQYTKEQRYEIAIRYIEAIQYITGERFQPDLRNKEERIIETTNKILDYLL